MIYDELIKKYQDRYLPEVSWLLLKAQIWQESRFDPTAKSDAGALGLMQLMPKTAKEMGCENPLDPEKGIKAGVKYLSIQYDHFSEIPAPKERIKFALASYNGGRGYVNKALSLARKELGLPENYYAWAESGKPSGLWQMWDYTKPALKSNNCAVNGHWPDARQMIDYVRLIVCKFQGYEDKRLCDI